MGLNVSIIPVHSIQPNNSQSAFISNKCCPALCANSSLLFGGGISERRIGIRKAGFFQSCGRFNGDENSKALKRTSCVCVCVIRHVRGKLERNTGVSSIGFRRKGNLLLVDQREAKARNSKEERESSFARAQLARDRVLAQWDSCKLLKLGNVLSIVNASRVYLCTKPMMLYIESC